MWVLYALLSAVSLATADAYSKKSLERADESVVAWIRFLFATPFLVGLLLLIPIPALDWIFWRTILLLLPIELLAVVLYIRAIKVSPLSLTIPFLSFTPVFLILTSSLMLGETVDRTGTAGIGLIALGAYLLHGHTIEQGWLSPLKAILKEQGSWLMILVAFLYSITSNLGKIAILHSSPVAFGVIYYLILTVAFAPIVWWRSRLHLPQLKTHGRTFLVIGFFEACMIVFHALAIAQTLVAYMIAVKRTSLLFSVVYGRLFFQETQIRRRFAGSLLMVIGVALIAMR
ncbi:MAG: EamA family transporter [Nitrospirae bacterium]|nr:EamA family transporter [Nitrospirota bacterium]